MANSGSVLPFVRGVDFTKNDFSVSVFKMLFMLFGYIKPLYISFNCSLSLGHNTVSNFLS